MRLDALPKPEAVQGPSTKAAEPTVGVVTRVPKSLHRKLRQLALDRDETIQDILLAEIRRLVE